MAETADTSSNWRRKEKQTEQNEPPGQSDKSGSTKEVEPDGEGSKADQEKPSVRFAKDVDIRQAKDLDDDFSDEEPVPIPFVKVKDIDGLSGKRSRRDAKGKKRVEDKENQQEKAYRLVSRFDDPKIVDHMIDKVSNTELEGITIGKMVSLSPEFAKGMRNVLTKTRKPVKQSMATQVVNSPSPFPYLEDIQSLRPDAINLDELPRVDSVYIATEKDIGTVPGSIICTDPVLQYLSTLGGEEQPKQIYAAMSSASLRTVRPKCALREWIESVLDGGSQIVSMALKTAERLKLVWDPAIQIVMQSANGQLKSSAGLVRNVPFDFDKIIVYLQVHIIDQDAYEILLGRPFEILTELQISNKRDGSQTITITDPNSDRKCTMSTYARGTTSTKDQPKIEILKRPATANQSRKTVLLEEVPDIDDKDYVEDFDYESSYETSSSEEQGFRETSMN